MKIEGSASDTAPYPPFLPLIHLPIHSPINYNPVLLSSSFSILFSSSFDYQPFTYFLLIILILYSLSFAYNFSHNVLLLLAYNAVLPLFIIAIYIDFSNDFNIDFNNEI